mgnify:CR=1 FL=1
MVSAKGVNSMIKPLHKFVLIKKEEKRKNKIEKENCDIITGSCK